MKKISEEEILNELNKFKHKQTLQVRFSDVDSMKVVHNVQYFNYLEYARTLYFDEIGLGVNKNTFTLENLFFTVRHELDYYSPLYFFEEFDVYSRIVMVKNSSVIFENLIINRENKVIVRSSTVFVYVDLENKLPTRLPDDIRKKISNYELDNCVFMD